MDAEATVRSYYDALRSGEPLYPYFAREATTVKFGIGERLTGYDAIRTGLAEQTETTTDWRVDSDRLVVDGRGDHAHFSDDVRMAWTDRETGARREFDTRWSGPLQRRPDATWDADGEAPTPWRFVGMHVSCEVRPDGTSRDGSTRPGDHSGGVD